MMLPGQPHRLGVMERSKGDDGVGGDGSLEEELAKLKGRRKQRKGTWISVPQWGKGNMG